MNLCSFLADTWCSLGKENLLDVQKFVIGVGFKDAEKEVLVIPGHIRTLSCLISDHKEADNRILLHAKHASLDTE